MDSNSILLSKPDIINKNTYDLNSKIKSEFNQENNQAIYKINKNSEVDLSNVKIPDLDDKNNFIKRINHTKDIIDKYDDYFKNFIIEGKYSKKKVVKDQVTLENFNKKNLFSKTKKNNKLSDLLKRHLPSFKSNNIKESEKNKNANYHPFLTDDSKNKNEDVDKMYYIKKVNLQNYKKLFNIGNTEESVKENMNYIENLPENKAFLATARNDDFSRLTQTKIIFDDNDGKFFNRNLAYGNDESALMAKLMIKMEIKKVNKEKDKKNNSKLKINNAIENLENSNFLKSVHSKEFDLKTNNNISGNVNNHNYENNKIDDDIKSTKNLVNQSKLNNTIDNFDNESIFNKQKFYYEKYSRNEIKEHNPILPQIDSNKKNKLTINNSNIYNNYNKPRVNSSKKTSNQNKLEKQALMRGEKNHKNTNLIKASNTHEFNNHRGKSFMKKHKLESLTSIGYLNTEIFEESQHLKNFLNNTGEFLMNNTVVSNVYNKNNSNKYTLKNKNFANNKVNKMIYGIIEKMERP